MLRSLLLPTGGLTIDQPINQGARTWRSITGPSGTVIEIIEETCTEAGFRLTSISLLNGGQCAEAVLETTEDLRTIVDGSAAPVIAPASDTWTISELQASTQGGLFLGSEPIGAPGAGLAQRFLARLHKAIFTPEGLLRGTGIDDIPASNALRLMPRYRRLSTYAYLLSPDVDTPLSIQRLPSSPVAEERSATFYLMNRDSSLVVFSEHSGEVFGASGEQVTAWLRGQVKDGELILTAVGRLERFLCEQELGDGERIVSAVGTGDGRFMLTYLRATPPGLTTDGLETLASAGQVSWRGGSQPSFTELGYDRVSARLTDLQRVVVTGFGVGCRQLTMWLLNSGGVVVRRRPKGVFDHCARALGIG